MHLRVIKTNYLPAVGAYYMVVVLSVKSNGFVSCSTVAKVPFERKSAFFKEFQRSVNSGKTYSIGSDLYLIVEFIDGYVVFGMIKKLLENYISLFCVFKFFLLNKSIKNSFSLIH